MLVCVFCTELGQGFLWNLPAVFVHRQLDVMDLSELQNWQERCQLFGHLQKGLDSDTQTSSFPLQGGSCQLSFSACSLCTEQGVGAIVSASPSHHIHSSLGNYIMLEPSEFQAWQQKPYSEEPFWKNLGAKCMNQTFLSLHYAEHREYLPDLMALHQA